MSASDVLEDERLAAARRRRIVRALQKLQRYYGSAPDDARSTDVADAGDAARFLILELVSDWVAR